jgi:hypothetical protein
MEGSDRAKKEHCSFLERHHALISDAARVGFRAHGRGAVFVFEDAILEAARGVAATVTIEYVPDGSDALVRRGGWPTQGHADLVRGYDPDFTIIVLVGRRRGGAELFTYQLVSADGLPKQEPPAWLEDLIG